MTIKNLIRVGSIALSLLTATAACSDKSISDNPSAPDPKGQDVVSFVIQNAAETNTRAESEEDFVDGTANESEVKDVLLVFFSKNGNFFFANQPEFTENKPIDASHTQEQRLEAQVAIPPKNGQRPAYVLCIINGVGKEFDVNHKGITMSELNLTHEKPSMEEMLAAVNNFSVELDEKGEGPKEPLLMTNSTYISTSLDGSESLVSVTAIPDEAFITPDDERDIATIPKVHIDVERVNARIEIDASKLEEEGNIDPSEINFDGEVIKVIPEIQGIQFSQLTKKSYLIKSLAGNEQYDVLDWKSTRYPRSYWATSPTLIPWSDKGDDESFLDGESDYIYATFSNIGAKKNLLIYPQENTSLYPTSVVITAILKDESGMPIEDMIDITGTRKFFMTMEDYKKYVATELQKLNLKFEYVEEGGTSKVISDDWAPFVKLRRTDDAEDKSFHVMPYVEADDKGKLSAVDAKKANDELIKFHPVLWYKGGMCYYAVEIQHDLLYQAEDGTYMRKNGIVRNHAYKIILKSLKGLGSPVYDFNQELIPDRPDEILEIQAEVHPLRWKMVTQEADIK